MNKQKLCKLMELIEGEISRSELLEIINKINELETSEAIRQLTMDGNLFEPKHGYLKRL